MPLSPFKAHRPGTETRAHFHVKKGDQVEVLTGDNQGATGKILQVLAKKQQVLIEGVRMIKKHARKSQDRPQGGIIEREGPIHISNVRLVEKGERKTGARDAKRAEKKAAAPKAPKAPKAAAAAKTPKSAAAPKAVKAPKAAAKPKKAE